MKTEDANIFTYLSMHQSSQENFFTQAFAFVLRQNKEICRELLTALFEQLGLNQGVTAIQNAGNLKIITQAGYENMYADMEIKGDDDFLVLLENKLDAAASKSEDGEPTQHNNYLEAIRNKENGFYLFITRDAEDTRMLERNTKAAHVQWHVVYEILENYKERSTCVKEFLDFMEEKGMAPAKLTKSGKDYAEAWEAFNEFKEFGDEFLETVSKKFEELEKDLKPKWKDAKVKDMGTGIDGFFIKYLQLNSSPEFGLAAGFQHNDSEAEFYTSFYVIYRIEENFIKEINTLRKYGFKIEDTPGDLRHRIKTKKIGDIYKQDRKKQVDELNAFFEETFDEIKKSKLISRLEPYRKK